ncbi:Exocyst complex component EXO84B [Camellia lanceoleosa]|uniref:Exocyst complex component EXO84B n=1 Tax=Camellia lanceoleosa TaxID=1840588 RepID=A0ACC0IER5_9ERIC|nr:Exocyst complex component EXO84B [Camellia lanceoleosa]
MALVLIVCCLMHITKDISITCKACPSSTSYGGAYTAALSQLVFSAIAQAASDSLAIFGKETDYTSELVMWATKQTNAYALLVKRHALASSTAAGGSRAAAQCVQIALGHCSLLEARGLALCPVLLKLFRPSVEQALEANLNVLKRVLLPWPLLLIGNLHTLQLLCGNLADLQVHCLVLQQHISINFLVVLIGSI